MLTRCVELIIDWWSSLSAPRVVVAKLLGRRRQCNDGLWRVLSRFCLADRSLDSYRIDAVPVLLVCLGHPIHADAWAHVKSNLQRLYTVPGPSLARGTDNLGVDGVDSQTSESTTSGNLDGDLQVVPAEVDDPMIPFQDLSLLTTKQVLNQCCIVDPNLFNDLTLREKLWHLHVRDAAIEKLRQELSEALIG